MKTVLTLFIGLSIATITSCNNAGAEISTEEQQQKQKEQTGTTWTPVALNTDETVSAFVTTKKGRIIAGTSAGIYISDDKGNTWKAAAINPDDKAAVFSLTIDKDNTLYAGLSKYGVLISSDNGNTWILSNEGLNKGGPRSSYAIFAASDKIFKGTFESGLYVSADAGKTWSPSNNGIPLNLTTNRMVSVTQLVQNKSTLYALTDLGVRYSTDAGKTWNKPAHNGIERLGYMTSLAVKNDLLLAGVGTSQKGLFVSKDNGNNWKLLGLQGETPTALFVSAEGNIYAGTQGKIYKSTDNGATWKQIGNGLPAKDVYAIGITPEGKVVAGLNRAGIYLLK